MYPITQNPAEPAACDATYDKTSAAANRFEIETDQNRRWDAWIRRIADGDMNALAAIYDERSEERRVGKECRL